MKPGTRRVLAIVRTLHIYLSMFALALMLLFGVTGFAMNHEWLKDDDDKKEITRAGQMPASLLGRPDRDAIVAELRSRFGISGRPDDFEVERNKVKVKFKSAGGKTEVDIHRSDGRVRIKTKVKGALSAFADIHKSHDTGALGSIFVDAAALILVLVSLTGLVLWISLRRRRLWGAIAMGGGLVTLVVFFFFLR